MTTSLLVDQANDVSAFTTKIVFLPTGVFEDIHKLYQIPPGHECLHPSVIRQRHTQVRLIGDKGDERSVRAIVFQRIIYIAST